MPRPPLSPRLADGSWSSWQWLFFVDASALEQQAALAAPEAPPEPPQPATVQQPAAPADECRAAAAALVRAALAAVLGAAGEAPAAAAEPAAQQAPAPPPQQAEAPWMLAVQFAAKNAQVDWLGAADVGSIFTLK